MLIVERVLSTRLKEYNKFPVDVSIRTTAKLGDGDIVRKMLPTSFIAHRSNSVREIPNCGNMKLVYSLAQIKMPLSL